MKSKIRRLLSPSIKCYIKKVIFSTKRRVHFRKKIVSANDVTSVGLSHRHCFFGYYDISPFNSTGDMLYLSIDGKSQHSDIYLRSFSSGIDKKITTSGTWNWQQGCRLRWKPRSDEWIMFNDFESGKYYSREYNIKTGDSHLLDVPIYDIDSAGKYGITLDYERLGVMRPGYGYSNRKYVPAQDLSSEGIDLVNLLTGESERVVTYEDIAKVIGDTSGDYNFNYINHLAFSPNGDKFLFFWLIKVGCFHKANLLVYEISTKRIIPLETNDKVSHYVWLDNDTIVCTAYNSKGECFYYKYRLNGSNREVLFPYVLNKDGHPSMYGRTSILTDTYPDRNSYQHLFLCNLDNGAITNIVDIYSTPVDSVERRTDLHPRLDLKNQRICIDANVNGKRKLYLINL